MWWFSNCRAQAFAVWAKTKVRLYVRRDLVFFDLGVSRPPGAEANRSVKASRKISFDFTHSSDRYRQNDWSTTNTYLVRRWISKLLFNLSAISRWYWLCFTPFGFFVVFTNRSFRPCHKYAMKISIHCRLMSRKAQGQQGKYPSKRPHRLYLRSSQSS